MVVGLKLLSITALLLGSGAVAQAADTYDAHYDRAKQLAGTEYQGLLVQCTRLVNPTPRAAPPVGRSTRDVPAAKAIKAFDNLYYVGVDGVSAWAVNTSEGIILIDALNNRNEAEQTIAPSLRRFGLDPAGIKYVVITHGHGDHYGGAQWLADTYGARIVASAADWEVMTSPLPPELNSPNFDPPPRRGLTVSDGEKLTLGDTTIEFHLTPGHTLGTISVLIPVKDGGKSHLAAEWGGTGFNFAPSPERFQLYHDSARKFAKLMENRGVDVMLSNHPWNDSTFAKGRALETRTPGQPNPFVVGTASAMRFVETLGECAAANRAHLLGGKR